MPVIENIKVTSNPDNPLEVNITMEERIARLTMEEVKQRIETIIYICSDCLYSAQKSGLLDVLENIQSFDDMLDFYYKLVSDYIHQIFHGISLERINNTPRISNNEPK